MANERLEYKLVVKDLASGTLKEVALKAEQADKALGNASNSGNNLNNALKSMGVALSASAIFAFGKEVVMATAKMQGLKASIKTASESSLQAEINFEWIKKLSNTYGLEVVSTAEAFKTLRGSMIGTKFTSADTRKMFEQVSMGATALGLSADDTKGVMLALGQIMSKGKVQAEELRGQIGERIPGAFSIAARAMGMTTRELDKFMADGKLISEDFLPKFANEMEKTFGKSAIENANGLTQEMNRMSSAWDNLISSIGNSDANGLMGKTFSGISSFLNKISDTFFVSSEQKASQIALGYGEGLTKSMEGRFSNIKLTGSKSEKEKSIYSFIKNEKAKAFNDLAKAHRLMSEISSGMMKKIPGKDDLLLTTEEQIAEIDKYIKGPRYTKKERDKFMNMRAYVKALSTQYKEIGLFGDKKISDLYQNKGLNATPPDNATKTARTSDIRNITINIGKMIEDLQIVTQSDSKIVASIEREVKKVIALAVNDFNALAH